MAKTQYRKFETIFPGKELRGFSPSSYIHVSVSDLYIPLIGLPVLLQENRWVERGNMWITHRQMNVGIGTEAAQFLFWDCINSNFFAVMYNRGLRFSKLNKILTEIDILVYFFATKILLQNFPFLSTCI
jgi:hypothetical protein